MKHSLMAALLALSSLTTLAATESDPQQSMPQQSIPQIDLAIQSTGDFVAAEPVKMFPAPQAGMKQWVLTLPTLADEVDWMVEIQIGQTQWLDCNKHSLKGELKTLTLEGWGYPYYRVDELSEGPSTLRACFELAKQQGFVALPGSLRLNYNSRMPIVFYLPENAELRYRLWQAQDKFRSTSKSQGTRP
ncbi:serine protease inhibitor ecotin [Shewanella cyperi]|uniref:Serine protease inhibitor ecotin n=1 Tax=Shewanella cyperi TaxID=2814292 RepID=A0A974XNK2_9GAMM|nr:serine protease inhibitor ecotin [Shewanella cyperi]QSX31702.1 serine protease inhibitor ecotin [Shewanella cyperi]